MKRFSPLSVALSVILLASLGLARPAPAQIKMEIVGPGSTLSPIAVPALKNLGGDDQHKLSGAFVETLRRDLELSGYFRIIKPQAYIENPQTSGYDIGQFNFTDWSSINAEFLVKGAVQRNGPQVTLEALLFDVGGQRRMMGKRFTGVPHDVRQMARRFADAVLEATTGTRGPFDAKLAYVSTRGGRFKEVYVSPIDGHGLFRVTDNPTINLFPSFDHISRHLLYLSYKTGQPALYLVDLAQQRETRIETDLGQAVGGTLTPDGNVVAAIERKGRTNLYLLDPGGREIEALTNDQAINVGPSVSSNGRQLAFASDRSGTPQIYVMSMSGGAARRLTFTGNYNTNPAFSPQGDVIAYQSRSDGTFDIYTVKVSGGDPVRLTEGEGSNQSPTWSPDGRYIAFSSRRGGGEHIYLMLVSTGKIISALTEDRGNDSSPAWSWWLEQ
jgi:TolB protein